MPETRSCTSNPLFVIGYKRSGTTMLRLILNTHPDIAIPPESEYFQKIPRKFGSRHLRPSQLDDIARALSKMKRCDFKMGLSKSSLKEIVRPVLPATVAELTDILYRHWATIQNKPTARWGDKKPQHWQFVYRFRQWYPDSQFVHIIRDPRDVYASVEENFPEQVVGRHLLPPHLITAWQWRMANLEMFRQGEVLGPKRYMRFRYESLVHDPEKYCKECCRFLGIEYTPEMLGFQAAARDPSVQGAKADTGAHMQTTKAVHSGQIGRHKASALPEPIIGDIEFICRDVFHLMGWPDSGITLSPARMVYLKGLLQVLDLAWKVRRASKRMCGSL